MQGGFSLEKQKSFYGSRIVIGSVIITAFTMAIVNSTMTLYQPLLIREYGFSEAAMSAAYSMAALGAAIGSILAGILIKKLPLRTMMLIGVLGTGSCLFIFSMANQLWMFYVILLFLDTFMALTTNVPLTTVLNNWFIDRRGAVTGIVFAGAGAGAIILPPIWDGLMNSALGWSKTAVVSAVAVLATALPVVLFVLVKEPSLKGQKAYTYPEGSAAARKAADRKKSQGAAAADPGEGISRGDALKSGFFWMIALGLLCMGIICAGVMVLFPNFLTGIGMNPGIVLATAGAGMLAGTFATGVLFDKLGLVKSLLLTALFFIGGMICMCFAPKAHCLAFVGAVLVGYSVCISQVGPPIITSTVFGLKDYSALYGLNYALLLAGCVLGPVICGLLTAGGYNLVWIANIAIAAGMFFFSLLGIRAGTRRRRKTA